MKNTLDDIIIEIIGVIESYSYFGLRQMQYCISMEKIKYETKRVQLKCIDALTKGFINLVMSALLAFD
jgi:hypothetical protein